MTDEVYTTIIAQTKETCANAGKPGFNEYGVPLHACHGYRHDEHYWARIRYSISLDSVYD